MTCLRTRSSGLASQANQNKKPTFGEILILILVTSRRIELRLPG